MQTDPATDFDLRFREIRRIFHDFHQEFIQDNTKDRHNMTAIPDLKKKIQYIHEALLRFLNTCLGEDATCESTIKDVKVMVGSEEDFTLTVKVHTLLTELCPLMFPWDVNMNARVGHIFYLFGEQPFSPLNLDVTVPDAVT